MIISRQSSDDCRYEFEVDQELQQAFTILRAALIRILGGGRFADGSGYVVLAFEADGLAALAALAEAGIQASELKPRKPSSSDPVSRPR